MLKSASVSKGDDAQPPASQPAGLPEAIRSRLRIAIEASLDSGSAVPDIEENWAELHAIARGEIN